MITWSITESSTEFDRPTHLAIRNGVMYTYSEILSDVNLQSLSYLEKVLNLGTSE